MPRPRPAEPLGRGFGGCSGEGIWGRNPGRSEELGRKDWDVAGKNRACAMSEREGEVLRRVQGDAEGGKAYGLWGLRRASQTFVEMCVREWYARKCVRVYLDALCSHVCTCTGMPQ
eukprot:6174821-Pleurochrysis_carterae.AAC.1